MGARSFLKSSALALTFALAASAPVDDGGPDFIARTLDAGHLTIWPSPTAHSDRIEKLRRRFEGAMPDVRVVPVDHDWFQQNMALNGYSPYDENLDREGKKALDSLLSFFVTAKTDLIFVAQSHESIDTSPLSDYGYAISRRYKGLPPQMLAHMDRRSRVSATADEKEVCLVFGAYTDISTKSQVSVRLGVTREPYADIKVRLLPDPEVWRRFVEYHEIAHCYNKWYLLQPLYSAQESKGLQALGIRHKSEMFSDIFATLMLARDGYARVAEYRAAERLVTAAMEGPYTVQVFKEDDFRHYMNYAYLLHSGLRAAQKEIDARGVAALRAMSLQGILELSHDLVEKNALAPEDTIIPLMHMFKSRYDLSAWANMPPDSPLFSYYAAALDLQNQMEQAARQLLDIPSARLPLLRPENFITIKEGDSPKAAESPDEKQKRAAALKIRLHEQAGGAEASDLSLVSAYGALKDSLRAELGSGDIDTRWAAHRNLVILPEVLRQLAADLPPARRMLAGRQLFPH